jgi:hypothetical protein
MYLLQIEVFEYMIQVHSEFLLYLLPHDLFLLFNFTWYIIIEDMTNIGRAELDIGILRF